MQSLFSSLQCGVFFWCVVFVVVWVSFNVAALVFCWLFQGGWSTSFSSLTKAYF